MNFAFTVSHEASTFSQVLNGPPSVHRDSNVHAQTWMVRPLNIFFLFK